MVTNLHIHQQHVKSNIWKSSRSELPITSMLKLFFLCMSDFYVFHDWLQDGSVIHIYLWINLYFLLLSLTCWVNLSIELLLPVIYIYEYISLFMLYLVYLVLFEICLLFYFLLSIYLNFIIKGLLLTLLYTLLDSLFAQNWFLFLKFFLNFYLFIYLFMAVLGLRFCARAFSSCGKWGHSSSRCAGLSLSLPLLLRSTGSRHAGSVVVAHGLSCSTACGIFPDQGSNPCPRHWQADSQPLRHQGSPQNWFLIPNNLLFLLPFLFLIWFHASNFTLFSLC